jgi:hypothetical protein
MLADRLQGGVTGDGQNGGLLEAHVVRLRRETIRAGDGVLGEGTPAGPEHLVPGPKQPCVRADRLDAPRQVVAEQRILWRTNAEARQTHHVRHPEHQVPDALVDARRMHAHQHLALARDRHVDLPESQNIDGAVSIPYNRPHGCSILAHLGFKRPPTL